MKIRPIRTIDDLNDAKAALARLVMRNSSGDLDDDIEILSTLIEEFERSQVRLAAPTPIAAIKFRMEEMGLSPRHLEPFIGSRARVSEVLSGKRSLSIDMIRSLHEGLGIPYASLISERSKSKGTNLGVSSSTIARLNSFGFNLKQADIPAFMRFSLPQGISPALLRKTRSHRAASKTDHTALMLWLAAVLKKAEVESLNIRFEPNNLTSESIRRLAMLSSKQRGPAKAVESLRERGVTTIILPPLPGTFLDGAAMLNSKEQPIVGLTLRHDRTDSFWFTLLHEVAHIHLHYDKLRKERLSFVDDIEIESEDFHEKEADALARLSLIPDSILSQVRWNEQSTLEDITAVASRARVHIAVVAGRWQRDHQNYRKFARLIERNTLTPMFRNR